MKFVNLYWAVVWAIIMAGCENRQVVNIEGVCQDCADGTPVELYYLQNDSAIIVGRDTLLHGKFNFSLEENPEMAYYLSVNDTLNPVGGMFFAEKGTVNIAFNSIYHVSGTPMNELYNTYLTETRRIEKLGEREYRRSIEGKNNPDTSVYDSLAQVYT